MVWRNEKFASASENSYFTVQFVVAKKTPEEEKHLAEPL